MYPQGRATAGEQREASIIKRIAADLPNGYGGTASAGLGAATIEGPQVSALENVAQRILAMANRLDDTNSYTRAFLERVQGQDPTRPSEPPMSCEKDGTLRPAFDTISVLLDRLEAQTYTAQALSNKLARIG